ncbi:MAG: hypothetical protein AAF363_11735 [Bacteroidota bacterium]
MADFNLFFEYSPWYIVLCLLLAFGGAWLIYSQKYAWSKSLNRFLFLLRFLSISLIGFLILAPFLKFVTNEYEKPIVALVLDNSISMISSRDSLRKEEMASYLKGFRADIGDEYDLRFFDLQGNYIVYEDSIQFDNELTNITKVSDQVYDLFRSDNFVELIVISDGIYNRGTSPAYKSYPFTVNTIGTGDSTELKDISISELRFNKIAYQGNSYPLEVLVNNTGYYDENSLIRIRQKGAIVKEQQFKLSEDGFQRFQFSLDADEAGLQRVDIDIVPKASEYNVSNNTKSAYIEVIDGRQQVLIAGAAPHPDIKMIRTILEASDNYDVTVYLEGLDSYEEKKYDLVVLHSLPSKRSNSSVINELLQSEIPKWIIVGSDSDLNAIRNNYGIVPGPSGNSSDKVTALYNTQFSRYRLSEEFQSSIEKYPPISIPFGDYTTPVNYDVLIYQRIGSLGTERPLWLLGNKNGVKTSILVGQGIWRWRLDEYSRTSSTAGIDQLIRKTVQYLASKDDKKRLKVYPLEKEYFDGERVEFKTEFYNEVYEEEYGVGISLKISSEDSAYSFSYTYSEFSDVFVVGSLPTGFYNYSASINYDNEQFRDQGAFIVKDLNLEKEDLQANFQLLREMASNSNGKFYFFDDLESYKQDLIDKEYPSIIHTEEDLLSFIDIHWILFFLILLIALEWFLRKYYGRY